MKKNVNIYIPNGKHVYYANFRAKRNDPEKGVISVQINRSTGSPSKATAQNIANAMRDAELEGLFGLVPKLRDNCPTVGDLIDRYKEKVSITSANEVARDFLRVAAEGAGITNVYEMEKARELRLSVLTADSMLAFRDRKDQRREPGSINKIMRSARSILGRRAREHYRSMKLPDLSGWLSVSFLPETEDKRFTRINETTLAEMDGAAPAMLRLSKMHRSPSERVYWLNAWITYWIMRRCGLRNSEVEELRWEWFREEDGKIWIELVKRPYWKPKGSPGRVPMARDLYDLLLKHFGPARPGPDGFVLKGTERMRWQSTRSHVNVFVRRYIPERTKGAYELRKQWGSEMARKHGLETASKLLRHRTIQTTWDHYYDDLNMGNVEGL